MANFARAVAVGVTVVVVSQIILKTMSKKGWI